MIFLVPSLFCFCLKTQNNSAVFIPDSDLDSKQ
jgi:hypothetical protein